MASASPGTPGRIGTYEITGEIGRGGIGSVLAGRDATGKAVAIKVLIHSRADSVARFERERRLVAALGARGGFVPLLDSGTCELGPYIVMEFVPGGTLRDLMERGPLPVERVLDLGRTVATALGRAHDLGVVHRDVKPENLLLDGEGRPLVADLGLAKHFRDDRPAASVALTKTGELKGTVAYMAPEQIEDPRAAGPPADVFALGLVLHECLAGRHPVEADNIVDMLSRLGRGAIPSVRATRPDAPSWLVAAIDRACRREPEARFPDGAAFAAALAGKPERKRRLWPWAALVAVLVAAVVFLPRSGPEKLADPVPAKSTPRPVEVSAVGSDSTEDRQSYETLAFSPRLRLARVLGSPKYKHATRIERLDVSANGKVAMTQSGEYRDRAVFWDLATARQILSVELGLYPRGIALSPDGSGAVIARNEGAIVWCDLARGTVTPDAALIGKFGRNERLRACSSDGRVVLTEDESTRSVTAWNRDTGDDIWKGERVRDAATSALSAAGDRVLVARDDHVALVEIATRHEDRLPASPTTDLVALVPSGRKAILRKGASFVVWEPGRPTLSVPAEGLAAHVTFSPDGKTAFFESATPGYEGRSLNLETGATAPLPGSPSGTKGRTVGGRVVDFETNAIRIWDAATGVDLAPIRGHRGQVTGLAFPAAGELVTTSIDGTIRRWDLASGRARETVGPWIEPAKPEREQAMAMALSADGRLLLSTKEHTGPSVVWELATGRVMQSLDFLPTEFYHLPSGFSADGKQVAIAMKDGNVALVSVATGERSVLAFERVVRAVCVGPGGLLGTGSELGLSFQGGESARAGKIEGAGNVIALAVSADAKLTASASFDGWLRLWDLRDGSPLGEVSFVATGDFPTALEFSGDGATLAVGTARGAVLLLGVLR